jgi:hypothetical protein
MWGLRPVFLRVFTELPRRGIFSETQQAYKEPGLLDPGPFLL